LLGTRAVAVFAVMAVILAVAICDG